MQRILMSADSIGGVWTYTLELAKALNKYNISVSIAVLGEELSPHQRKAASAIDNIEIYESRYKLEWMDDPWEDVEHSGQWLLELEAFTQPDLVHLNGYAHGVLGFNTPKVVVGHSCVFSWFEAVKGHLPPAQWNWYKAEVTKGLKAADFVIAPSGTMMNYLHKHYGQFNNSAVIYNARSRHDFHRINKSSIILSAGRLWDEAKNLSALARIAGKINIPVFLAGEDESPMGEKLIFENVKLLGKIPNDVLAGWMGHSLIYALPAKYEPFGLSVLEAALSGCALVLGDIDSLRELWDGAAVFVSPDSDEAWLSTLNYLGSNSKFCNEIARRCYRRALNYQPERMGEKYLAVYNKLLKEHNHPGIKKESFEIS